MARTKSLFVCQECGHDAPRWSGQCSGCGAWNSLAEEAAVASTARRTTAEPVRLGDVSTSSEERISTTVEEFDRVMGGGIVPGSVTLVAGDPGIGKSTLLTEISALLSDRKVLYVCGEESPSQVRLRTERMGLRADSVHLLPETDVDVVAQVAAKLDPLILVVDSIQTLFRPDLSSAPGSISQVRESAARLIRLAKRSGMATFLVGHVTKDGGIAGPRVLEHMVDTVLHLEGDRNHSFRILRAMKNRFGSTNEIGVFEMQGRGLVPVSNPSALFLSERDRQASGSAVVCTLEGTRPMLAEIQALVTPTSYSTPQRSATGYDGKRLQMLLAVLEKREGMRLSTHDVFVNIAGGLRLTEPAVDLGIAMAVGSSLFDRPLPAKTVVIGEIGLAGEVRSVSQLGLRLREASKLGFDTALVPRFKKQADPGITCIQVERVQQAVKALL